MFLYFERNISCNFDGLATFSLSLSPYIALFVSSSNLLEMISISFPQTYRVVSSAKSQISICFFYEKKQIIDKIKRIDPSINPYDTASIASKRLLKDDFHFLFHLQNIVLYGL